MKKSKGFWKQAIALILIGLLFISLGGQFLKINAAAAEVTQGQIDALKTDAEALAAEKQVLTKQLEAIRKDKSQAQTQKNLLEQQINVIQSEIDNINTQIDTYAALIEANQAEVSEIQQRVNEQYELFCKRVRAMEENGTLSYWSVLFGASSFAEIIDAVMIIEEIIEYDQRVMDDLTALKESLETEQKELETAKTEQEAAKAIQVAAQDELKVSKAEVDALVSQISSQEDELEAAEAALKKEAAAMDKKIQELEQQYKNQIAKVPSESGYLWPLPASWNTLSSLYGSRIHPITGQPNNHSGIDIPATAGTEIYAAKSGVITTSTYSNSYGNYVVVSHSDGSSTLYAHMSKRNATVGQTVNQGTVIGYVGTTGSSTGNHLHFEVRINGKRTDPINYFKDKTLYVRSNGKTELLDH